MRRYWFGIASLVLAFHVLVSASSAVTITIGHTWDTNHYMHKGLEAAARAFAKKAPGIALEIRPGINEDKFIVQAIGGAPPDIQFVDGPMVSSFAVQGLIQPLSPHVEASGVMEKDFIPPAWRQGVWEGQVWALPVQVAPNFGLVWNQDLFRLAGLDASSGPETVADFEAYHKKLTRYDGDKPVTIGNVPWDVYGAPNTMYTWGWIFGGEFYNEGTRQITAHHDRNAAALEWLRDYHRRFLSTAAALGQGLPSGRNRFSAGREAMVFATTGAVQNYVRVAPDLNLGLGKVPYDEANSNHNPTWVGGFTLALASGSKHPKEAWQFLHFLTADPEGTAVFGEASGSFPGYLRTPVFRQVFAKDRFLSVYMDIVLNATKQRPVIPVQKSYFAQLTQALADVFAGKSQPRDALRMASARVQDELTQVLSAKK